MTFGDPTQPHDPSSSELVSQARQARARAADLVAVAGELRARAEDARARAERLAVEFALLAHGSMLADVAPPQLEEKAHELRTAVEDYARRLRDVQTTPEQSLVLVKRATASLAKVSSVEVPGVPFRVTEWFVAGYYGTRAG